MKNVFTIIFEIMKKENTSTSRSHTFMRCKFKKPLFRSSCPEVFCKKGVLRNLQISLENTWASLFFNKVAGLRLWYRCFPVNFAKFLRTLFLIEHLRLLLLFLDGAIQLHNFKFPKKNNPLLTKYFFSRSFRSCTFFHESVGCVKNGT